MSNSPAYQAAYEVLHPIRLQPGDGSYIPDGIINMLKERNMLDTLLDIIR